MTEDTIPLEAGIEDRAISLTKGCYVGQEIIIRVLHRGHGRVARRLVGLTLRARSRRAGPGGRNPQRRSRDWRGHERRAVAGARATDRDGLRPPGFRRSGNRRRRVGSGSVDARGRDPVAVCQPVPAGSRASIAMSSASAGGNSSDASSLFATQRISWPSIGRGSPRSSQRKKCSSTMRSGYSCATWWISAPIRMLGVELLGYLAVEASCKRSRRRRTCRPGTPRIPRGASRQGAWSPDIDHRAR